MRSQGQPSLFHLFAPNLVTVIAPDVLFSDSDVFETSFPLLHCSCSKVSLRPGLHTAGRQGLTKVKTMCLRGAGQRGARPCEGRGRTRSPGWDPRRGRAAAPFRAWTGPRHGPGESFAKPPCRKEQEPSYTKPGKGSHTDPKDNTPSRPHGHGLGPETTTEAAPQFSGAPGISSQLCACPSLSRAPSLIL